MALFLVVIVSFGRPVLAASKYAAIVIDANSGRVLHQSNADTPRFPASLTKMMTLYIVFDMLKSGKLQGDSRLIVTKHATKQIPSKLYLKQGETILVRDAIKALVTKSANDVATTIADNLAGSEVKFARYMTWKARQLGMLKTTFKNASGLPHRQQVTTARDMSKLALRLYDDFPDRYRLFKTRYFKYRGKSYRNHNGLLFNFKGTDGIKTGYTRASGFNLVASVQRGRKRVVGVVMGGRSSRHRNSRMRSLLRAAFKRSSSKFTRRIVRNKSVVVANKRRKPSTKSAKWKTTSKVHNTSATSRVRTNGTVGNGRKDFHVQIAAVSSSQAANRVLSSVRQVTGNLLTGYRDHTTRLRSSDRKLYRARFAGFTRTAALATCGKLKRQRINCIVMPADY